MQLIHGDSNKELFNITGVDTIITDPPYGLSFMGKKWDYDVPSEHFWKVAMASCKPGATALVFAGSRTYHRMACNMEDAGWILKDCIMWLYGSGFPKATDISKQLDKNKRRDFVIEAKRLGILPKDANRSFIDWTKEGHSPSDKYWAEFKRVISKENWEKIERKVLGIKTKRTVQNWMPTSKDNNTYITEPSTPEAKLWNGWKSHGLKPAYEPIIVAMKPNDGTYANNALKHGVAGLNIDGGRISTEENLNGGAYSKGEAEHMWSEKSGGGGLKRQEGKYKQPQGRFPANIILDEEVGEMLDEQSGVSQTTTKKKGQYDSRSGFGGGQINIRHNDKGGASRFFYCAKASKKERNAGCEGLEEKTSGGMAGTADQTLLTGSGNIRNNKATNFHPTVKPLALMEYLVKLTATPTGGTVLDPFMGSGTTGIACKNQGRDFIGIEMDEDYYNIAKARI